MKKLFSYILLCAAMMVSGSAWATAPEPLTFTNSSNTAYTFYGLDEVGSYGLIPTLQSSTDNGKTWTNVTFDVYPYNTKVSYCTFIVPANGSLQLRGTNPIGFAGYVAGLGAFSTLKFVDLSQTGRIAASGNIMSLIDSINVTTTIPSGSFPYGEITIDLRGFSRMFTGMGAALTSAPELPATELAPYCYEQMFIDCTNLERAPSELPATTLKEYCYKKMFENCSNLVSAPDMAPTKVDIRSCFLMFQKCTSLTTAPEKLPAETLAEGCYSSMFAHCHKLTKAPELPATTLDTSCYGGMFQGCKSLEIAPELPAKELAYGCYGQMFEDCTSLSSISVGFTQWRVDTIPSITSATSGWLPNQAIDFHCPLELPIERNVNNKGTFSSKIPPLATVYKLIEQDDSDIETKLATAKDTTKSDKNYTIKRTMYKDGGWNTICLPVKVNSIAESCLAGCSLYAFTSASIEGDVLTLTITDVTDNDTLSAGVPYLIKWADGDDMKSMSFNGPIAATSPKCAGDGIQLKGTFAPKSIVGESSNILFVGANNTLYWPKDGDINGFRAYFEVSSNAPVRRGMTAVLTEGRTTPTGMNQVTGDRLQVTDVEKLIEQGKVVIMCDGVKYNLNGQIIQ